MIAGFQPVPNSVPLCGDLGHLHRIDDIPVAIEIEPIYVESDAASGNPIGIAQWENLPCCLLPQLLRFCSRAQQCSDRAFACPRTPGFPTVLSKHQPDDGLILPRVMRNRP